MEFEVERERAPLTGASRGPQVRKLHDAAEYPTRREDERGTAGLLAEGHLD